MIPPETLVEYAEAKIKEAADASTPDGFPFRIRVLSGLPADVVIVYSPPSRDDLDPAASLPRRAVLIQGVGE